MKSLFASLLGLSAFTQSPHRCTAPTQPSRPAAHGKRGGRFKDSRRRFREMSGIAAPKWNGYAPARTREVPLQHPWQRKRAAREAILRKVEEAFQDTRVPQGS